MIDSPTLKYGARDWECPTQHHTYKSVPDVDEDGNEFSCHDWRRYHADPNIDLAVIIAAANELIDGKSTLESGEGRPVTRRRKK